MNTAVGQVTLGYMVFYSTEGYDINLQGYDTLKTSINSKLGSSETESVQTNVLAETTVTHSSLPFMNINTFHSKDKEHDITQSDIM